MRRSYCFLVPALLLSTAVFGANSERDSIAAERKALAARFAAEEKACAARFAVTACMDEVRVRRREALAPLRERELRLDEAERHKRAEERRAAIAARQAEAATRPAAPPEPQTRVRQPVAPAPAASRAPRSHEDASARAADAARRAQDAQQREQEAQAVQERIQRRQAERDARGVTARPLPTPAASAAAR